MRVTVLLATATVVMTTHLSLTWADVVTSMAKINHMVEHENNLLRHLWKLMEHIQERLDNMTEFYLNQTKIIKQGKQAADLRHPNAFYRVISRFDFSYKSALSYQFESFLDNLKMNQIYLAGNNDVIGAQNALLRIQKVYSLRALDMAEGNYLGCRGPKLDYVDAYILGSLAIRDKSMNEGMEWLNASLTLYEQDDFTFEDNNNVIHSVEHIKAQLGMAYLYMGDRKTAEDIYKEVSQTDPEDSKVDYLRHVLERDPEKLPQYDPRKAKINEHFANYSRLCQLHGRQYYLDKVSPLPVCRYRQTLLPYFNFKEEILSVSPFITLFYNVISDYEGDIVKEFVSDKLVGSLAGVVGAKSRYVNTRSSAWINETPPDFVTAINRRISLITGLETHYKTINGTLSIEPLQVVNYGIGGHYEIHSDPNDRLSRFSKTETQHFGKRMATFQIYLTGVEKGGATVFTEAGVAVTPVKNAALMWFNYDPSLRLDHRTVHGGCPVVVGHKWILNKWIGTYENTFRQRCGLRQDMTQLDIEPDLLNSYL